MFAKDWSHIANIWYLKANCIWWSGIISAFREFFKVPWEFQPKSMYTVFFLLFLPFTLLASVDWQPDDRIIPICKTIWIFIFNPCKTMEGCFFPTKIAITAFGASRQETRVKRGKFCFIFYQIQIFVVTVFLIWRGEQGGSLQRKPKSTNPCFGNINLAFNIFCGNDAFMFIPENIKPR